MSMDFTSGLKTYTGNSPGGNKVGNATPISPPSSLSNPRPSPLPEEL